MTLDNDDTVPSSSRGLTSNDPFEIGSLVEGKYRIIELLGKGGMGAVYRATQILVQADVALKTLDKQRLDDPTSIRRFQTEAKATFQLKHPNLINVLDFGVLESEHPFLVMELVDGISLQEFFAKKNTLSPLELQQLFSQLCFGLDYAHQHHVVHRDIKPANIMIRNKMPLSQEGSVLILDFGIAKILHTFNSEVQTLTATGDIFGSPLYMSPEQCSGDVIDQRSDIYSLGCVLFEAITGTPPFRGTTPLRTMMLHQSEMPPTLKEATLGKDHSPELERIVRKMLAKSKNDRYQDLGLVAIELANACTGRFETDQAKDQNHQAKRERSSNSKTVSMPVSAFISILVAAVVISLIAGLTIAFQITENSSHTSQETAKISNTKNEQDEKSSNSIVSEMDTLKKARLNSSRKESISFQNTTAIKYHLENGGTQKVIEFPEVCIGSISYPAADPGKSPIVTAAQGPVTVPANVPLTYEVSDTANSTVFDFPSVFEKLDKSLFQGLKVTGVTSGRSTRAWEGEDTAVSVDKTLKGMEKLIHVAGSWKNLKTVEFVDLYLTPQMVADLQTSLPLQILTLHNCEDPSEKIFDKSIVSKIEKIWISDMRISRLLDNLQGKVNLQWLTIEKNCTYTAQDLLKLTNCKNIAGLNFRADTIDRSLTDAALKIKSLVIISFKRDSIADDQLQKLLKNNWMVQPATGLHGLQWILIRPEYATKFLKLPNASSKH